MNVIETINHVIQKHVTSLFSIEQEVLNTTHLSIQTDKQKQNFGDLSSNAPLIIAKEIKEQPRIVAQKIKEALQHPFIEKN